MGRNRMAAKPCPDCEQQVPVACKTCPCGYSFFAQKRTELGEHRRSESKDGESEDKKDRSPEEENKPRRTERTKRLRPDFYNSVEIEKKTRKQHVRRRRALNSSIDMRRRGAIMLGPSKSTSILSRLKQETTSDKDYDNDNDGNDSYGDDNVSHRKRGRPKHNRDRNGAIPEERMYDNISADKSFQYSVILADINRKICVGNLINVCKTEDDTDGSNAATSQLS